MNERARSQRHESQCVPCPTCRREVAWGAAHFPFCCERCRLADLGHWLEERYRIPSGPPEDEEEAADPVPRREDPGSDG